MPARQCPLLGVKESWPGMILQKKNLSDEHQVLLSGVHPGSNFKDCVLPNWNSQIVCDPHFRDLRVLR